MKEQQEPILQIYQQDCPRDVGELILNREAALQLINMILMAVTGDREQVSEFYSSDSECYFLRVQVVSDRELATYNLPYKNPEGQIFDDINGSTKTQAQTNQTM